MKLKISLTLVIIGGLFLAAPAGFSQGALTPPPGAPAPTLKTLAQIEPRTPLATNTTPGDANDAYIITQPGSYYLTTNLVGVGAETGIEILANNVTLDLNGFCLQSVVTNAGLFLNYAISIPNTQTNITVRNGLVNGWDTGVFSLSAVSANVVVEHVSFANCVGSSNFAAQGVGILGAAVVRDCTFENDYYGVVCNGDNSTIPSLITGCTCDNAQIGFSCGGSGIISGCTANNCQNSGIDISGGQSWLVSGCTANNNNTGISIISARCRVENNHISVPSGGFGMQVYGAGNTNNIIIKNSIEGGGVNNYILYGTQITGPIITATGPISSTSPWANFSY